VRSKVAVSTATLKYTDGALKSTPLLLTVTGRDETPAGATTGGKAQRKRVDESQRADTTAVRLPSMQRSASESKKCAPLTRRYAALFSGTSEGAIDTTCAACAKRKVTGSVVKSAPLFETATRAEPKASGFGATHMIIDAFKNCTSRAGVRPKRHASFDPFTKPLPDTITRVFSVPETGEVATTAEASV
jgi:hypothetical protein